MPSYSYHLKLELYSSPDPTVATRAYRDESSPIWLPSPTSTIFDNLPPHARKALHPAGPAQTRSSHQANRGGVEQQREVERKQDYKATTAGVIDCGIGTSTGTGTGKGTSSRGATQDTDEGRNLVVLGERQWRARAGSTPTPGFTAGIGPETAAKDWRFGRIKVESFDLVEEGRRDGDEGVQREREQERDRERERERVDRMAAEEETKKKKKKKNPLATPAASLGPTLGGPGQATKARYERLETKNTELGWGIAHLYREGNDGWVGHGASSGGGGSGSGSGATNGVTDGEDGTILCIPSVPSYLSPSDFLGFVGEKWRRDVSHYRMVMTSRMNRYMVLMKFRDGRMAAEWRKEFDGKVFNTFEAEICHVTYIKSITIETPQQRASSSSCSGVVNSPKPFPPPTPDLTELPTCAVCLERMDDTTDLMTILCQHVFHCTCLQTWKGSGCPVCRATNPKPKQDYEYDANNPYTQPFGSGISNLCSVCDESSDLWICLICGNVGCGRYKGAHAKDHWKTTAHSFSLELETQHVWDYAGDMWVHRLIREKGDGKVVELPSHDVAGRRAGQALGEDEDVVPRAKLDSIGMEYTHLLTSQLESQRVYFEELVSKAVDKASHASAAAEAAGRKAQEALGELSQVRAEQRRAQHETIPSLERDVQRERARADKAEKLARSLGKALQDEKEVSAGLMVRVEHVNKEVGALRAAVENLRAEKAELQDANRDLTMFISGQERLRELESEGKVEQAELEEGTASVPEEKKRARGKGRAKK